MINPMARLLSRHRRLPLVLLFSALILAGCGQDPEPETTATSVPALTPTQSAIGQSPPGTLVPAAEPGRTPDGTPKTSSGPPPTPTVAEQLTRPPAIPPAIADPTPSPTSEPDPSPAAQPTLTPAPVGSATPESLPSLDLLFPQDGSILESAAVRVLGNTQIGATATINSTPVVTQGDGRFQHDLALEAGLNKINVEVTDSAGLTASESVAVFVVPAATPLPFNVFYPRDGIEVRQRDLPVSGVTKPDAVVLVNGISVEVNALGIYSGVVVLEDDTNLIEVVATDIFGNLRSHTIAVFYTP